MNAHNRLWKRAVSIVLALTMTVLTVPAPALAALLPEEEAASVTVNSDTAVLLSSTVNGDGTVTTNGDGTVTTNGDGTVTTTNGDGTVTTTNGDGTVTTTNGDGTVTTTNGDGTVTTGGDGTVTTGGDGGGGTGSVFTAPPSMLYAEPGRWSEGALTPVYDVELLSYSDNPNVFFFYYLEDFMGEKFGFAPTEQMLSANYGEVQFAFVYSDTAPSGTGITDYCPIGMTAAQWQSAVADYESQYGNGGTTDYAGLLATLNWVPASEGYLRAYSDDEVYGTASAVVASTYQDRYYSVFLRWVNGDDAWYAVNETAVYLHEKEQGVIDTPFSDGGAHPYLTAHNIPTPGQMVISHSETETGIDFRYAFTDGAATVWSNIPDMYNPTNGVTAEYLWTYTDYENLAGTEAMTPVGMASDVWNTMRTEYLVQWYSAHSGGGGGRTENTTRGQETAESPDYAELFATLSGWTTDPTLPLLDDAAVYGTESGAGVYGSRYYSCLLRIRLNDGSGYEKIFFGNSNGYVYLLFGDYGKLNAPVTMNNLELQYYDVSKGIWDGIWMVMSYSAKEPYTDYVVAYSLTDALGQNYGNLDGNYFGLPSNARMEYLWTYVDWESVAGNSQLVNTQYRPYLDQIPIGMTKSEWDSMRAGKSGDALTELLGSLSGWTEDRRLPTFSKGEREGTTENRTTYDRCYYGCFVRLLIEGEQTLYYWNTYVAPIEVGSQGGPSILYDWAFTIGYTVPEYVEFTCNVTWHTDLYYKSTRQWYVANDRISDGTPLAGETKSTLTIPLEPDKPHDKYYYCAYSYETGNGRSVQGRSNAARVTVTYAPTGHINARHGVAFYGDHDAYSPVYSPYGANGTQQLLGSKTTLSAYWRVDAGECFYMTWQWYESDTPDELGTAIGDLHTVWNPVEDGFTDDDASEKCDVSLACPSDTPGVKYYRVLCTNYNKDGDSFSCMSDPLEVTTLADTADDTLFEIDEDGRLLGYYGFEDTITIPETVNGIPVKTISSFFGDCSGNAPRIIVPEGVETIEDEAFLDTYGLREITLPSTLKTIGVRAFKACKLRSLTLPEGLESIGFAAFQYAFSKDAHVVLRCSDCSISSGAFYSAFMRELTFDIDHWPEWDVGGTIHQPPDEIYYHYSFEKCPCLYVINLPEDAELSLDGWPYIKSDRLTWVDNADSLTEPLTKAKLRSGPICGYADRLGTELFRVGNYICANDLTGDYQYLEGLDVNPGIRIEKVLYFDGDDLVIPDTFGGRSVTGLGMQNGYDADPDLLDPQGVYSLHPARGFGLTDNITALQHVTLPASLRHIAADTFRYADLRSANLDALPELAYVGARAFSTQTELTGTVILPKNCIVMNMAFWDCRRLTELRMDNAHLFDDAFSRCIRLTKVDGTWTARTNFTSDAACYVRYFHLVPAFPVTTLYTHTIEDCELTYARPCEEAYDYQIDAHYTPAALHSWFLPGKGGSAKVSYLFRQYITGPYVYCGTSESAFIMEYIGAEDTALTFPAELYNEELDTTFHITGVFCDDTFVENPYTVTVEDGIL
nr:leucine-rich repeat protein [Oscillospiraceae bacterium]